MCTHSHIIDELKLCGRSANNPTTRQSMQTWFPFHIRERIADITEKYPNGFIRTGIRPSMYAQTSEMEREQSCN